VRQPEHLMLPCSRDGRIKQASDADALGQSALDRGFYEARRQRDRQTWPLLQASRAAMS
jgi:hypothetical protein